MDQMQCEIGPILHLGHETGRKAALVYECPTLFIFLSVNPISCPTRISLWFFFFEYVYVMPISGGKRSKVVEVITKLQAVL